MTATRRTYYNPMLDPHCQAKMTPEMKAAVVGEKYENGGPLNEPDADHPANLVSSLCDDGMHRPALDLDLPSFWVPSSTEGHAHLYVETPGLSWRHYKNFLAACADAGMIEEAYLEASIRRGQTLLRPPGVSK